LVISLLSIGTFFLAHTDLDLGEGKVHGGVRKCRTDGSRGFVLVNVSALLKGKRRNETAAEAGGNFSISLKFARLVILLLVVGLLVLFCVEMFVH
jgi:hypothetical protein